MRLEGKVALVTGAQQGIGRAIAVALARDGADVGVNFLDDAAAAEKVAGEIRGLGRRAVTVQGDVSQTASVQGMVKTVVDALGWELAGRTAGLAPGLPHRRRLETILGFSSGARRNRYRPPNAPASFPGRSVRNI